VATGPRGLTEGGRVKTVVDLSTTGTTIAKAVAASLSERAIEFIDAPVSGGVAGARAGTLAVMVGAAHHGFARIEPVLRSIGKVFHVGDEPGAGQAMKVANNYLSATTLLATSEAVVFGVKAGLDPQVMIDVLNAGSGRSSASEDKFPRSVLNRRFDFGFTTALIYKDLRLFTEQAEALGIPLPLGSAVRQVWFTALTALGADADFTKVITQIESMAGVHVDQASTSS
jgi:3-hydroxyisobutyrate dehydrogenase-like beta-hydroxyacid dehydrogenase